MSINVQKLIDEIENRFNNLDSNSSVLEISRVNELNNRKNASALTGGLQYNSLNQANAPSGIGDSANVGQVFFVADEQLDTKGRFYFRTQSGFVNMKTEGDSDENDLITTARANQSLGSSEPSALTLSIASNIMGETSGFSFGSYPLPVAPGIVNRYSYASDGNATSLPLTTNFAPSGGGYGLSASGPTHGWHVTSYPGKTTPSKFPYASQDTFVAVPRNFVPTHNGIQWLNQAGNSSTHVHVAGSYPNSQSISKYPQTADGDYSDVGDLTRSQGRAGIGQHANSPDYGYISGGEVSPRAEIVKWSYVTDGNATLVGNLVTQMANASNANSETHGYAVGTSPSGPSPGNGIEKWPFSSDANATDVGDLLSSKEYGGGTSSTTHGYRHGGRSPATNVIEKFSFSTDGNSTDVGDLTYTAQGNSGFQE